MPEYYTVLEAARVLKKHPNTIRRYCKKGNLPYKQYGVRCEILIPASALGCEREVRP